MSRLPIVDFRTMEKALLHLGFQPVRQKGSHVFAGTRPAAQRLSPTTQAGVSHRGERLKLNGGTLGDPRQPKGLRPAKLVIGIEECEEGIPRIGERFLLSLAFSNAVGQFRAAGRIPAPGVGAGA